MKMTDSEDAVPPYGSREKRWETHVELRQNKV